MHRRQFIKILSTGFALSLWGNLTVTGKLFAQADGRIRVWSASEGSYIMADKVVKTEAEWRAQLTPEQYHVTREHGTERAFSGAYDKHYAKGVYQCVCCGQDLFHADHKFDSGTGWPSYYQPIAPENIGLRKDRSWLMVRNEVHCSRCEAHLGHVFDDGPRPTGLRYCINSVSLSFVAG